MISSIGLLICTRRTLPHKLALAFSLQLPSLFVLLDRFLPFSSCGLFGKMLVGLLLSPSCPKAVESPSKIVWAEQPAVVISFHHSLFSPRIIATSNIKSITDKASAQTAITRSPLPGLNSSQLSCQGLRKSIPPSAALPG